MYYSKYKTTPATQAAYEIYGSNLKHQAYKLNTDKSEESKDTPETVPKLTNSPKTSVIKVVTAASMAVSDLASLPVSSLFLRLRPAPLRRSEDGTPAALAMASTSVTSLPSKVSTVLTISAAVLSKPLVTSVDLFSTGEAMARVARPKAKMLENFIVVV